MISQIAVCITALLFIITAAPAHSAQTFDPSVYAQLADSNTSQSIQPGTTITPHNWSRYRRFMTVGMQALFSGAYPWRIPSDPNYAIVVGPTRPIPLAKALVADTEKYANQTRIVKLPNGGYTFTGYVAGIPFPNPAQPDEGAKAVFDIWVAFRPYVSNYLSTGAQTDRYGNTSVTAADVLQYRLDHLSDPPHPQTLPDGKGRLFASRFMVVSPEQSKYTAQLAQYSDDPTQVQELFVFLPSLRRSLRLSSASRCSPILGGDYVQDDGLNGVGFQPGNFSFHLLGEKKIVAMAHADPAASSDLKSYNLNLPLPGWPKAAVGKWELRDVYVVDAAPVADLHGYCYSHKVIYIDRKTYLNLAMEVYDAQGKLWKAFQNFYHPVKLNDGEEVLVGNTTSTTAKDLQNSHSTLAIAGPVKFDGDVSGEYQQYQVWATPSGLDRILR